MKRSPPSASKTSRDLPRRSHTTHEWTGACPVVAVYNDAGTKLISYKYDAWGNTTVTYHNGGASTTAAKNPFRYRGYYYDIDLGLYYLNTRYYDSKIARFINADSALYHNMLGYNMFAYCNNNPINYVDYSGESAGAVSSFFGWLWGIAVAEPTPVGEIIAGAGTAIIGGIWIGKKISEGIEYVGNLLEEADDPPQSITEPNNESSETANNANNPSSPGKMQKEVESGRAPKRVKSVHKPHNAKTGKPHVHFKDGTAMNNDGSPHDAHKGEPKLTKPVKEWLGKHNWSTSYKIFP